MQKSEAGATISALLRFPGVLLTGFFVELVNLFAITVTQGFVQVPPLPVGRFESFGIHAAIAIALFGWHQLVTVDRGEQLATVDRTAERAAVAARVALVGLCLLGWRLYFEHGVRLSADSPHYFAQAHSVLFDLDLDFDNDYEQIRPRIQIAERYPVGLALFSLPFLMAAHALVIVSGWLGADFPATGFGYPYETAFELTSLVLASVALVYLLRVVAGVAPVGVATLALVSALSSSFLAWYVIIEPGMPHAMSFAWSTFMLGYWIDRRPLATPRQWVVVGALAGAAALTRWQAGVLIVLPLIDAALDRSLAIRGVAAAGVASVVVFIPQLVFWTLTAGSPFAMPSAGHDVSWSQLRWIEVLFSTNRGLFPWNPVLYLATAGLVILVWRHRRLGLLFLTGLALQVYVNGTVGIWWAGWSFGGRRFDSCFLFFVFGLAVLFDWLRRRPMVLIAAGVVALFGWNFELVDQARRGAVPPDRLVSFRDVSRRGVDSLYEAWGYPFTAPASWAFAARHGVSPEKFDRLFGHVGFGNFRTEFDDTVEPYLGHGWGVPERNRGGGWFRWSVGRESTLLIPLKTARDYELAVTLSPFAGATPNRAGVRVNGAVLPARVVNGDETTLTWTLEASLWRPGLNEVTFYYARTARPPASGDPRELAAAFTRLELVALPSDEE